MNLFLFLGPPFIAGDGPKMVYFGPKWPTVAGLSTFQSGPKGTKMVNLCFWPFGPLWIISDKIEIFAPNWLLEKHLYSPLRYQFQQIYQGTVWQIYNLYKTFQMRGYVKLERMEHIGNFVRHYIHPIMVFVLEVNNIVRDTCQWLSHLMTISQSIILPIKVKLDVIYINIVHVCSVC